MNANGWQHHLTRPNFCINPLTSKFSTRTKSSNTWRVLNLFVFLFFAICEKKLWCISIHVSQSPAHNRVFTSNIWHSDKCHWFHSDTTSYKYQYVQFSPRQDSPGRTFEYYRLLTSPRLFPTAPPSYNSTVCVEKRESSQLQAQPVTNHVLFAFPATERV